MMPQLSTSWWVIHNRSAPAEQSSTRRATLRHPNAQDDRLAGCLVVSSHWPMSPSCSTCRRRRPTRSSAAATCVASRSVVADNGGSKRPNLNDSSPRDTNRPSGSSPSTRSLGSTTRKTPIPMVIGPLSHQLLSHQALSHEALNRSPVTRLTAVSGTVMPDSDGGSTRTVKASASTSAT